MRYERNGDLYTLLEKRVPNGFSADPIGKPFLVPGRRVQPRTKVVLPGTKKRVIQRVLL
jgi:hypothetical protein